MAIASGLTCAITNPLSAEVKGAVMAADVLMGNDQDAARWIRAHRDAAVPAISASHVGGPAGLTGPGRPLVPVAVSARPRVNRRALARDAGNGSGS
jgi:hypothetical protein